MLRRSRPTLLLAAACVLALVVTGVLALLVPAAHVRDAQTLQGFRELDRPRTSGILGAVAHLADPAPYALIGLVLIAVAFLRGRRRLAALLPVVLVGSGATTQLLKDLLASPRMEWLAVPDVWISDHAWPSGHATASMTLALCAVMAVPARWRPAAAAVGAAFAIAVSYSILALAWHFPSDVLGGFLVAALWVLLALSALAALERRRPERVALSRPRLTDAVPVLVVGVPAGLIAVLGAIARPGVLEEHTTFFAGAAVIAGLALVLASLLAGALRGPRA